MTKTKVCNHEHAIEVAKKNGHHSIECNCGTMVVGIESDPLKQQMTQELVDRVTAPDAPEVPVIGRIGALKGHAVIPKRLMAILSANQALMDNSTLLHEAMTGTNPLSKGEPVLPDDQMITKMLDPGSPNDSKNYMTHSVRWSDSSLYDEMCTVCGARDFAPGQDELSLFSCTEFLEMREKCTQTHTKPYVKTRVEIFIYSYRWARGEGINRRVAFHYAALMAWHKKG